MEPEPDLGLSAREHDRVLRVLLVFRVALTLVSGAPYLSSLVAARDVTLVGGLTVVAVAGSWTDLLGRGPDRLRRRWKLEASCLPVLILAVALLDDRAVDLVPVAQPLDGFAIASIAVIAYLGGWSWAAPVGGAVIAIELVDAIVDRGTSLAAVALLSQRVTWLVAAAIIASFVRGTVQRTAAAEHAAGASRERLQQHRALHDRSVQTLTAVATGATVEWPRLQADAADEAARLRQLEGRAGAREGLLDALRAEVATRAPSLPVALVPLGSPAVPDEVADAVWAATGEALTNVEKHARAASTVVSVDGGPGWLRIEIVDDGVGLGGQPDGFGISHSIRGRMLEVGGQATVTTGPGGGTGVSLRWSQRAAGQRAWSGPAGQLPWRTSARMLAAMAFWQCAASLTILVVAQHMGGLRELEWVVAASLLPAVICLLILGTRADAARTASRLIPAVPLALGVVAPVLGALAATPRILLEPFGDPLTPYAEAATAAAVFVGGTTVGVLALLATGCAALVVAPLMNGYAPSELLVMSTGERLLLLGSGLYFASAVGRVTVLAVERQRAAAVAQARVAEAVTIGNRLLEVLLAIGGAPASSFALRQRAFVALAWCRQRLSGSGVPMAEDLVVGLAEVTARHLDLVQGPPQILTIGRLPAEAVLAALWESLDLILGALPVMPAPVTITARGDQSRLRVTLTRASGPPPLGAARTSAEALLAACEGELRLSAGAGGFRLLLTVPVAAPNGEAGG